MKRECGLLAKDLSRLSSMTSGFKDMLAVLPLTTTQFNFLFPLIELSKLRLYTHMNYVIVKVKGANQEEG